VRFQRGRVPGHARPVGSNEAAASVVPCSCLRARHVRVGVKECRRSRLAQARRWGAEPCPAPGPRSDWRYRRSQSPAQCGRPSARRRGAETRPASATGAVEAGRCTDLDTGQGSVGAHRPPENCAHPVGGRGVRSCCEPSEARQRPRRHPTDQRQASTTGVPVASPRRQAWGATLPGGRSPGGPPDKPRFNSPGLDSDRQQGLAARGLTPWRRRCCTVTTCTVMATATHTVCVPGRRRCSGTAERGRQPTGPPGTQTVSEN